MHICRWNASRVPRGAGDECSRSLSRLRPAVHDTCEASSGESRSTFGRETLGTFQRQDRRSLLWHTATLVVVFSLLGFACLGQQNQPTRGTVRTYFIAADRVDWDYTPRGRNLTGVPVQEGAEDPASNTPHRIYPKAIYREYTDATFKTLKARPPQWEHLGILGPLIRAEVGDTIRVVFRNNTKLSCTMHPHGLEYAKASEGALYSDGDSTGKAGDMVRPGETYTYIWYVPEGAGPGPMDGSSVLWMYHSHFIGSKDMNTGLLGPIIVTARGAGRLDGTPKDVDREFVLAFAIFDETDSWYFDAWSTHVEHSGRM